MATKAAEDNLISRTYAIQRPDAGKAADTYIRRWERQTAARNTGAASVQAIPPAICFSRRIGAGALEIATSLSRKINYRIADRIIIDTIARESDVTQKTVQCFDERYPGRSGELASYLFGEKSFVMNTYTRQLISVVFALAESEPTIFIGRGTHLILPRERILAIRLACSRSFRVHHLAEMLQISKDAADKKLKELDFQQNEFFNRVFGRKEITSEDFDLVINCDQIQRPDWVAEIVECAFNEKFSAADRMGSQATDIP